MVTKGWPTEVRTGFSGATGGDLASSNVTNCREYRIGHFHPVVQPISGVYSFLDAANNPITCQFDTSLIEIFRLTRYGNESGAAVLGHRCSQVRLSLTCCLRT